MGLLEEVLERIRSGERDPAGIARELGVSTDEVLGAIKILQSLGYVEEVKKGEDACSACPLRRVCSGSCVVPKGSVYRLTEKSFSLVKGKG
jgi:radical SAM protein with 4Fe4S-binding SPASM domain